MAMILVISIGAFGLNNRAATEGSEAREVDALRKEADRGSRKPDIYYLILDGYANSSTLKEVYGYDNQGFEDYLEEKGFKVASESRSNYAITALSLASSLNMEYINYLSEAGGVAPETLNHLGT